MLQQKSPSQRANILILWGPITFGKKIRRNSNLGYFKLGQKSSQKPIRVYAVLCRLNLGYRNHP